MGPSGQEVLKKSEKLAFLLYLFGGVFFGQSGNMCSLIWLPLFEDLASIGEYNWGGAVLCHLMGQLRSFSYGACHMGGLLCLLQFVWDPYTSLGLEDEIDVLREGQAVFARDLWLHRFDLVHFHQPSRYAQQFGLYQQIPTVTEPMESMGRIQGPARDIDWEERDSARLVQVRRGGYPIVAGTRQTQEEYWRWYEAEFRGRIVR